MIFGSKSERNKVIGIAFVFFVIQFLYVFIKNPCATLSDEFTYKQIAFDIYQGHPVSTFHYPLLYPFLISVSFLFGEKFYLAILFINVLVKTLSLMLIYKQLTRIVLKKNDRFIVLVMIMLSPIYFLYSDWIMAENLFSPLLVMTLLYYVNHNEDLLKKNISLKRKMLCSFEAGLLAVALYQTKYLALVLFPILFLLWFIKMFYEVIKKKASFCEFILNSVIWTVAVLFVIVMVFAIYCIKSHTVPVFALFKESLGFSSGSGPENTGYRFFPEIKWIICYTAYTFIGAVFVVYLIYKESKKRLTNIFHKMDIGGLLLVILGLIYVASRHSSFVEYNNGGVLLKLLGRYVSYGTIILVIVFAVYLGRESSDKVVENIIICTRIIDISIGGILCLLTFLGYFILYRKLIWKPADDWLDSLRGLDNLGFREYGVFMVVLVATLIIIYCFTEKREVIVIGMAAICVMNAIPAFSASDYYGEMRDYVKSSNVLMQKYRNKNVTVFSTRMDKYIGSLQSYSFLFRNQFEDGFRVLQAGISDAPVDMPLDRFVFFTVLKDEFSTDEEFTVISDTESNVGYLLFEKDKFKDIDVDYQVIESTEGKMILVQSNDDYVLMVGNVIIPYTLDNGVYSFLISFVTDMDSRDVTLYNFTNLTRAKLVFD